MIRAVLIEDQPDLAEALRETIEFDGRTEVVAVCHTLGVSADVIARLRPDVVVTDFRLPDGDSVDEFDHWRTHVPECAILVMSAWTDERSTQRARDAGARAFVEKGPELDMLADVIALVAAGGSRWLDAPDDDPAAPMLTPAGEETDPIAAEVLEGIRAGRSTIAIATELHLSEHSVRRHVNSLLRAHTARTRQELVDRVGGLR